jgi:hypothetical protein
MRYPVLEIDYEAYKELADNVWQAQRAGWPQVLTYNGPDMRQVHAAQRRAVMRYEEAGFVHHIPRILSRDEYPFACTAEGGKGWVGHIPPEQNSAQGGLLAAFLRRNQIAGGRGELSKFRVRVVNHPGGRVRER